MSEPRKHKLLPLLPEEDDLEEFDWSLEKKAYGLLWFLLTFCLFWLLIDKREPENPSDEAEDEWNRRRANWVLGWLTALVALWLIAPDSQPWKTIFGIVAAYRLFEILVTGLGTILDQRQQVRARNVITILIYAIQATLIFAILYHSFAATEFTDKGVHPTTPSDFLYISWSAIVSLGQGRFSAEGSAAQFLEVATTTTAIFLLTVLFAYAIDTVVKAKKDEDRHPREELDGDSPPPTTPEPAARPG